MDKLIAKSQSILGGTPVFRGTRVPIKTLLDYLEAGDSLQDFLADFPSVKHSQAVLLLERLKKELLIQYERAA